MSGLMVARTPSLYRDREAAQCDNDTPYIAVTTAGMTRVDDLQDWGCLNLCLSVDCDQSLDQCAKKCKIPTHSRAVSIMMSKRTVENPGCECLSLVSAAIIYTSSFGSPSSVVSVTSGRRYLQVRPYPTKITYGIRGVKSEMWSLLSVTRLFPSS